MREKSERTRRECRRSEKPVVLIVVEGETEEGYFKFAKRKLRARWIEVEKPNSNDPCSLVSAAKREKRRLERDGLSVIPWAVFDAEARDAEDARGYGKAIAQAEKSGIRVANSSPCFEYWLLLHFAPGILVDTPAEASAELARSGRVDGYKKPDLPYKQLWEILIGGSPAKAASARRASLEADGMTPRMGRPVTYVDQLMTLILEVGGILAPSESAV